MSNWKFHSKPFQIQVCDAVTNIINYAGSKTLESFPGIWDRLKYLRVIDLYIFTGSERTLDVPRNARAVFIRYARRHGL